MISIIIAIGVVIFVIFYAKIKCDADGVECTLYGFITLFGALMAVVLLSAFMANYYPSVVGEEKLEVYIIDNEMFYMGNDGDIKNVDNCSDVKIDNSVKKPYILKEIYDDTYWLEGCKHTLVLPGNIA